jgi:hypothetical protein
MTCEFCETELVTYVDLLSGLCDKHREDWIPTNERCQGG